jgi:hypothetical protein
VKIVQPTTTSIKYCECWLPAFGEIDGDRRVVFCRNCNLVIGCVDEQNIYPRPEKCTHQSTHVEELDFGYPSREKADWVDDPRDCVVCDDCEQILYEIEAHQN